MGFFFFEAYNEEDTPKWKINKKVEKIAYLSFFVKKYANSEKGFISFCTCYNI